MRVVSAELRVGERKARAVLKKRRERIGTLTRTIESLGLDRKEFYQALAKRIEPREYILADVRAQSVIGDLRGRKFRVGLVSNSGRPLVRKILRALDLAPRLFDLIVTSSEVEPKPSPEPFQYAIRKLGSDPMETVYVGDRDEAELRPARELGLRTILLKRKNESSRWADVVIGSIMEVPKVVRLIQNGNALPRQAVP